MTRTALVGTALIVLTACGSVEEETLSTMNIDGREYNFRTQTINGPQGTFQTHAIQASNGSWRTCDPTYPKDCLAARRTNSNRSNAD